jgi:hypothetical protein
VIAEKVQIGLFGAAALLGGVFILVRRKLLSKSNAKDMDAWLGFAFRFNYSEEFFVILNTAGGIVLILFGVILLIGALFRDSENRLSSPLEFLILAIVGFIFAGGLLTITYVNIRFRKAK